MPKAEVGSVKHLNKQMKARGLTRLRWYCQVCERALRDENSFKQHTLSESHVRNMLVVGADPRKVINEYSDQFLKDFVRLLRTGHGEKQVQINHFYQEYIAKRDHIHMNATRWSSLTELAKHLGRESICRVEENEKGIFISWIDTSPEALRRQEALRRKEAQDRGDEEMERRLLQAQIARAEAAKQARAPGKDKDGSGSGSDEEEDEEKHQLLHRPEGDKVKLSFGSTKPSESSAKNKNTTPSAEKPISSIDAGGMEKAKAEQVSAEKKREDDKTPEAQAESKASTAVPSSASAAKPMSLKLGGLSKPQPKNVFAAAKKNALSSGGGSKKIEVPKKMTEAERIMKEELERKRGRGDFGGGSRFGGASKRQRF